MGLAIKAVGLVLGSAKDHNLSFFCFQSVLFLFFVDASQKGLSMQQITILKKNRSINKLF